MYDPYNGSVSSDLERPLTYISRSLVIDTLDVLCAQLTRDLFAIAKFLLLPLTEIFNINGSHAITTLKSKIILQDTNTAHTYEQRFKWVVFGVLFVM